MPDVSYLFKALWGGWLLFWLLSAWGNKRTAMGVGRRWLLVPAAAAVVLALAARESPEVFRRRLVPEGPMFAYIGLALTVAGLGLTIWSRRVLGTNWSGMPVLKHDHELIQRGPYALVRHPIYTGLLIAIFGSCFAEGHTGVWLFFLVAAVLLVVKLKTEEAILTRQFPEAYPAYQQRAKALIPFIY